MYFHISSKNAHVILNFVDFSTRFFEVSADMLTLQIGDCGPPLDCKGLIQLCCKMSHDCASRGKIIIFCKSITKEVWENQG